IYNSILETSAPWLDISPEEGAVPPLDACDVIVTFNPDGMEPSIYEAEILIISSDPLRPTIIVPVTMTLVADDLSLSPDAGFESSGIEGGPFTPQCMTYTLTNNGNEPVSWTTAPTADWLNVAPASGVLDPCDTIGLGLCISPQAELLQPGVYTETLTLENLDSGSIKTRLITLTVIPPDSFTESFGSGGSDLHNLTLTLRPDGSSAYYAACYEEATQFPTDPCGGTYIALGDDDFAEIILNQPTMVSFYGQSYDRIYIGSNGYITFGQGDVEHEALLENHFALPRMSAMFADLTPTDGQSISWKQLDNRLAVTYENVPLFGDKQKISSFQIEIFFTDETIRVTRLNLAATSSIMGISRGTGIPAGFFESDLSEYLICCPCGDFDGDYAVNLLDFAILAASWLDNTCQSPYWCDWTDIDRSNVVDPPDLAFLTQNWLYGAEAGPGPEPNLPEPIAYWKFDEGEGDTAYDSVGDNHGTIHEALWTDGQIDGALDFDGTNDYITFGHSNCIKPPLPVTITAWITLADSGVIYTISSLDDPSVAYYGLFFQILATGELIISVGDGNGSSPSHRRSKIGTTTLEPNNWYHVTAVVRGETDMDLYVNAVNDGGFYSGTGGPLAYSDGNAFIGSTGGSTNFFNGKIDDVRVYDWALSADEIQALYQMTTQSVGQNSQYYWSEPVLLEELNDIPNGKNAYSPCLSQDGLTMFFGRRSASGTRQLVEAYRDTPDGPFTSERVISELVTGDNLYSPWISNDELRLYYGRYENGTTLRMAQRNSPTDTWTDVKGFYEIHVGGTSDSHATLMPDELTMFYCSNRGSSNYFVWTTNRESLDNPFTTPTPVSELNDSEKSQGPCILTDGLTIYFNSIRDGHTTSDIYRAIRPSIDVPFGNIERISISTDTKNEYCPDVTPDEKTLYFHTDQGIFVSYWKKDEITICLPR
ncbi:MAG: hypothetical protein KAT56_03525, partial [Sedimentisphaerales bacterium]|nr:hypothetical protein [Sedimentisphaerales bacterium]